MRRTSLSSLLSLVIIVAGFACGASNSDLYATMPSEPEPNASGSASQRVLASASAPLKESERLPAHEDDEEPPSVASVASSESGLVSLFGQDSSGLGVLGGLDVSGLGGLGLRGTGTGIGSIGTGRGGLSGGRAPGVSVGQVTAKGQLPPEVIKRIVRQNFGRFRLCYEKGLRSNPSLAGRVTVRFVIGRDGSVVSASEASSTLHNRSVSNCVVGAFRSLSFPQPAGGIVTVDYPLTFSPGAAPPTASASARAPAPSSP